MTASLDIKFDRLSKVYRDGETVGGSIVVNNNSNSPLSHQSISILVEGVASLTLSSKNVGRIEALYNTVKSITLFTHSAEIAAQSKLPEGSTSIPFHFKLKPSGSNKTLYETYHGVYINIQYFVKCLMKRPLLNKDLIKEGEFLVECKQGEKAVAKPFLFTINPNSIKNTDSKAGIPRFSIRGNLDSSICCITRPFTGELTIERADAPIRTVELHLMRVETVGCAEGYAKEETEIQNIEIGAGDICHGLAIPIYMIFPRLFSCPTLETTNFKIEFQVNIVVIFNDDRLIMDTFPIKLTRF